MKRQTISLLLLCSAVVMIVTGVALFMLPVSTTLLGLGRGQLKDLHKTFMVVFIITAVVHMVWNRRAIASYLTSVPRPRRPRVAGIAIAVGLTALLTAGTLVRVPPFSSFIAWGASMEHRGEPPRTEFAGGPPGSTDGATPAGLNRSVDGSEAGPATPANEGAPETARHPA